MSLDLDFDDGQLAIADAVAQLCREKCPPDVVRALDAGFSRDLWLALAELGVLGMADPDGEAGACDLVAAFDVLGTAAFPGPLADTVIACCALPEPERIAIAGGDRVVSLGTATLAPWCDVGDLFLELDGEDLWLAPLEGPVETLSSLGGERWGRGTRLRLERLENTERALFLGGIALAAYLVGAGRALVEIAAEHARSRMQFGRAIGEFQAVAHPLADAHVRVGSSATLVCAAACAFDDEASAPELPGLVGAAWISARGAALEALATSHQVLGAQGVAVDGPLWHLSRCIRQRASHPLGLGNARESVLELFANREAAA